MKKFKNMFCLSILLLSGLACAQGKTNYAHITMIQPDKNGTYISNCPLTTTQNSETMTFCITTPKCGSGKFYYLPKTNENYDAFLSVALGPVNTN